MRPSKAIRFTALVLCALMVFAACTASNSAPKRWRTTTKSAQTSPYGAWVSLDVGSGQRMEGELIAVEDGRLWLASGGELVPVPEENVRKAKVVAYTASNNGLIGWTTFGTLSTLSHGFVLVLSAPIWMLYGGVVSRTHSSSGYHEYGEVSDERDNLRRWARFPQGLPDRFRQPVAPKPAVETVVRGKLGTPCFPNLTCDTGLVCDQGTATCVEPPPLGGEGGPCYANGTCDPGFVCDADTCRPSPPAPEVPPAAELPPGPDEAP